MKAALSFVVALVLPFLSAPSFASLITVNPTSDGSLYTCPGCTVVQNDAYVLTSGYIQGAVKFSSADITAAATSVLLTLNPYGLPLGGPTVDIYGYGTSIATLDISDANAGAFLGTLTLPSNLGYGEDAYFDVTAFAKSISAPYLAFNLRSTGTDVFSSLEYNYGHPSQLLIQSVPEPRSMVLLLAGLVAAATMKLKSRRPAAARVG